MGNSLSCFKAYDIRGRVPGVLNAPLARALGRAVVEILGAKSIVIGRDARLSGPELRDALAFGLREAGAQVVGVAVVVDRSTGAAEAIEAAGLPYRYAFGVDDLNL